MNFGIWELLIILLIVSLLFGTKKLRSIGGDLGSAIKGFRSAIKDDGKDNSDKDNLEQKESGSESQGGVIEGEVQEKQGSTHPQG